MVYIFGYTPFFFYFTFSDGLTGGKGLALGEGPAEEAGFPIR